MSAVQQKISCVYETGVLDEPSNKRPHQPFKVTATGKLSTKAVRDDISSARATEKLDGTCCLIAEFKSQPWLWARHDRKPTKSGERRFAQHRRMKAKLELEGRMDAQADFKWDATKDFKDVPEHWVPADSLDVENGIVMPDKSGHTPGWVPVLASSRQHCWHLEAVNLSLGVALILRENQDCHSDLVIECQPLSQLCGQTFELIGTNINGNPYNLGTKKCPFHILIAHGSLALTCPDPTDYDRMVSWMTSDNQSCQVEGIVWHCRNEQMYKLHRHHLNLSWPDKTPLLCQRKVKVQVSIDLCQDQDIGIQNCPKPGDIFLKLSSLNGQEFDSLLSLCQTVIGQSNQ